MESRSSRFRFRAIECEEAAALADTESRRQEFLDFARQWRELAKQAEFLDEGASLFSETGIEDASFKLICYLP